MTTAAEEAHQAEEVSEVVPGSVVVDLVDVEAGYEERNDEHERGNKALPESEPESGYGVLVAGRAFQIVRAGSAGGEDEKEYEGEEEGCEFHGGDLLFVVRDRKRKGLIRCSEFTTETQRHLEKPI
jgi:hypothetical protein